MVTTTKTAPARALKWKDSRLSDSESNGRPVAIACCKNAIRKDVNEMNLAIKWEMWQFDAFELQLADNTVACHFHSFLLMRLWKNIQR